jgi:hypothetical protein
LRKITVILLCSAALISGAFWVGRIWQPAPVAVPESASVAPLEPVMRLSMIRVPVVITRLAIGNALESQIPHSTTGSHEDPIPQFLTGAQIDWSVDRGSLEIAERADALNISTELAGRLHIAGTVAGLTDDVVGTLGDPPSKSAFERNSENLCSV